MTDTPLSQDRSRAVVAAAALMSLAALSTAWIAEYGFDLFPCVLCLYQRLPYMGALALAALCLMPVVDPQARRAATWLCAALFVTTAAVAAFHVGVEQGWWEGTAECGGGLQDFTLDDMRAALSRPGRPSCSEAAFTVFGISMAGYNVLAGLGFAAVMAGAARQRGWWSNR